jgi:hypothetical protein
VQPRTGLRGLQVDVEAGRIDVALGVRRNQIDAVRDRERSIRSEDVGVFIEIVEVDTRVAQLTVGIARASPAAADPAKSIPATRQARRVHIEAFRFILHSKLLSKNKITAANRSETPGCTGMRR